MRFTSSNLSRILSSPEKVENQLANIEERLSGFVGVRRKLILTKSKNMKQKFVAERSNKQEQLNLG